MSQPKKSLASWRYGTIDLFIGIFLLLFPVFLMKNFYYAYFYLLILSSLSSLNAVNISKKVAPLSFSTSLINFEDVKCEKALLKKTERKEFTLLKGILYIIGGILACYVVSVLFGAPVFESQPATLYFSCVMTLLTIYPMMWYFYFTDSIGAVVRIFTDIKSENMTEIHLHYFTVFTIIGAWFGAFPISLDWDRAWQTWPIPCCAGSSLGYSVGHIYIGVKLLYSFFKDKKKSFV